VFHSFIYILALVSFSFIEREVAIRVYNMRLEQFIESIWNLKILPDSVPIFDWSVINGQCVKREATMTVSKNVLQKCSYLPYSHLSSHFWFQLL